MKLGIFADGSWGLFFLKEILKKKSFSCKFISGRNIIDKEIKKLAIKKNIPFFVFKDIKSDNAYKKIKSLNVDMLVSMSYDQIFDNRIINICKIPPINCHAGKLPKYRGRNVINWAIIKGEKEIGITVHFINKKIDKGNIILQKIIKISNNDNYNSILKKCYVECPKLLIRSLNKLLINKKFKGIPQSKYGKGFYCKKRVAGDELINWNVETDVFNNFVRGITLPGPCAQSKIGKNKIYIIKSKTLEKKLINKNVWGKIKKINKNHFDVFLKNGIIRVLKWKTNAKLHEGLVLK
jgi:methionyl-tRNA formyltransferase